MHVFAPKPAQDDFQMFFNVDQSVGQNGSNTNSDDILLVQFFIKTLGNQLPPTTPEGRRRKERAMNVPLTGRVDAATIDGIRAFQEITTGTPDGRVSVARGYSYGAGYWTIAELNASIRDHFRRVWPRLQDIPGCPNAIASRVSKIL